MVRALKIVLALPCLPSCDTMRSSLDYVELLDRKNLNEVACRRAFQSAMLQDWLNLFRNMKKYSFVDLLNLNCLNLCGSIELTTNNVFTKTGSITPPFFHPADYGRQFRVPERIIKKIKRADLLARDLLQFSYSTCDDRQPAMRSTDCQPLWKVTGADSGRKKNCSVLWCCCVRV